ncbi:Hypothetical protein NGAL_HAMBI1145_09470 [Neorhizobium galegae bv. officinalis]|uniref:Uncharacterized protein n=1 Tax=Neorhizobium galegae bv. officinalis TaxID=323656 RepID=A0A0T7FB03_NEOGA|nr:Hypothetical protein NGAL_HAMBI1145_09470 [Neorhizobium galegae bv. officinalis]
MEGKTLTMLRDIAAFSAIVLFSLGVYAWAEIGAFLLVAERIIN